MDMDAYNKIAAIDVRKLFTDTEAHDQAKIMGALGGGITGAGIVGRLHDSVANDINSIQNPNRRALATILGMLVSVGTVAGGAYAGSKLGGKLVPERARWKLGL